MNNSVKFVCAGPNASAPCEIVNGIYQVTINLAVLELTIHRWREGWGYVLQPHLIVRVLNEILTFHHRYVILVTLASPILATFLIVYM